MENRPRDPGKIAVIHKPGALQPGTALALTGIMDRRIDGSLDDVLEVLGGHERTLCEVMRALWRCADDIEGRWMARKLWAGSNSASKVGSISSHRSLSPSGARALFAH